MSRPQKIWLTLARDDFEHERDDWAHRSIAMAVAVDRRLGATAPIVGGMSREPGEVIVTAQWFALRRLGWAAADIVLMTEAWGGYTLLDALRRSGMLLCPR